MVNNFMSSLIHNTHFVHRSIPSSGLSLGVGVRELGLELPSQRDPTAGRGVELTERGTGRSKGGDEVSLISGEASLLSDWSIAGLW